jgi:hypothetical protein
VVEVALVRLTQPDTDRTIDGVIERLDRLERAQSGGDPARAAGAPGGRRTRGGSRSDTGDRRPGDPARAALSGARDAPGSDATPPDATAPDEAGVKPSAVGDAAATDEGGAGGSARPTLGALARNRPGRARKGEPAPNPADPGSAQDADVTSPPSDVTGAAARTGGPPHDQLVQAWSDTVLATLPIPVRSKWRGGRWIGGGDGPARFAVPNAWHQKACEGSRREVEAALARHFGTAVGVVVVVEGEGGPPAPTGAPPPGPEATGGPASPAGGSLASADTDDHEDIDPTELRDADDAATGGIDLVLREFGGQLIEEEP